MQQKKVLEEKLEKVNNTTEEQEIKILEDRMKKVYDTKKSRRILFFLNKPHT